jgi:hypothetical protein
MKGLLERATIIIATANVILTASSPCRTLQPLRDFHDCPGIGIFQMLPTYASGLPKSVTGRQSCGNLYDSQRLHLRRTVWPARNEQVFTIDWGDFLLGEGNSFHFIRQMARDRFTPRSRPKFLAGPAVEQESGGAGVEQSGSVLLR